jgi:SAM-dependent methyltransferase
MELFTSFANQEEYQRWIISDDLLTRSNHHINIIESWHSRSKQSTEIWGWCDVCSTDSFFLLDEHYSDRSHTPWQPNWRERLVCTGCSLNARMRASFSLLSPYFNSNSQIWIMEQTTTFYKALSKKYANLVGSEYYGAEYKPGELLENGIRNEDCTNASFENETLDGVLSFDVLEHLPQFESAMKEAFRILRPGGVFFWTAPFNMNAEKTSVRATVRQDGTIQHLMDPIMHGDPINPSEGILCFQIFGWDILNLLRKIGFSDAKVAIFWSKSRVILGEPLPFFIAKK